MTSVLISLAVGIVFVFVWGIFSYIASSGGEFKSFFVGGLANFVFFFGGIVSTYLAAKGTQESSVAAIPLLSSEHNGGFQRGCCAIYCRRDHVRFPDNEFIFRRLH